MKGEFNMLNELKTVNEKFIGIIKENSGVLAAWYFGSNTHGLSDEYSDIDIVLLADEASYCD
ncbi:MAG: nucleotidyltransferase domain-containing protein, partial [Oscillospiraceae bacterium]|nr:nucleotidyltransferase domain-containing protein [Oscillospiraceae bacterium]